MNKNYFIFLADPPAEGPTAELIDGPDVDVYDGTKIGVVDQEFEFRLEIADFAAPKHFPPSDVVESDHEILFSRRLINVLHDQGVDTIEYLPAKVSYAPTGEACDYMVANVLGVFSGLDMELSVCQFDDDGFMYGVEKMVFDEAKFMQQKMFRLKENMMLIIVRKDIKDAIENEKLTGIKLIEDVMWQPGMI